MYILEICGDWFNQFFVDNVDYNLFILDVRSIFYGMKIIELIMWGLSYMRLFYNLKK